MLTTSTPAPVSVTPPGAGNPTPMALPANPAAGAQTPPADGQSRITEIIPPGGANAQASAEPCVNVFVRSAQVDGRQVVSVDMYGDGLIKAAVLPQLAGELLAHAGSAAGADGARAACVAPALAQSLFHPVINVAGVDAAVKVARVGERWVLAGSRAPQPVVAQAQAPLQLAAARTRDAGKLMTEKTKKTTPAVPVPNAPVVQAKPRSTGTVGEATPKRATTSAQQDPGIASSERRSMFASSIALLAGGIVVLLVRPSARRTGRKGSVTHA